MEHCSQAQEPSAGALTAIAGLVSLAVAMGIGRFAFTPLLPMMQQGAAVSLTQAGWLASANYAGYLAGALWAGVQPVRSDLAIRSTLIVIALATAAVGLVDGVAAWAVLRFVAGVASAWGLIHVATWSAARLSAVGRSSLGGVVYAGVGTGIAVTGLACLLFLAIGIGWREAWIMLGVVALAATVVVWRSFTTTAGDLRTAPSLGSPIRVNADSIRLILCYGAFGLGYIIPATYIPAMARHALNKGIAFGWAWPVFGFAAGASTLIASPLMARYGNRRVWAAGATVMALGVASPVAISGLTGILVAAVGVGATFMVLTMAGLQEARAVGGAQAKVLVAALTAAFAVGQIVGPILVSLVVAHGGTLTHALLIAFGFLLVSVVALAFDFRPVGSTGSASTTTKGE
jgi:predicted MFS family arabinose efflux permease